MKAGKQENAEESLRTLASDHVGWHCFIVDLCSAKKVQEKKSSPKHVEGIVHQEASQL